LARTDQALWNLMQGVLSQMLASRNRAAGRVPSCSGGFSCQPHRNHSRGIALTPPANPQYNMRILSGNSALVAAGPGGNSHRKNYARHTIIC
jgi:hypothetical protein